MNRHTLVVLILSIFFVAPAPATDCLECWWEAPVHLPMKFNKLEDKDKQDKAQQPVRRHYMPSLRRHYFVVQYGLEKRYQNLVNPIKNTKENVRQGEMFYARDCGECHGISGFGDGEDSRDLRPAPADLYHLIRMSMMTSDSYLYWTIAEGGEGINSQMPAFKTRRSEDEIWKIIIYLRYGLSR